MMRCRWLRLKNGWKGLLNPLKKHETTIYSCIVVFLLCLSAFFVQDIKHTKEVFQLQDQQAALILELEEVNEIAISQMETMQEQNRLVDKYQRTLQAAENALGEQSRLIRDLVNYLKKIGHWPPKEPRPIPEQPDRSWAISLKEGGQFL